MSLLAGSFLKFLAFLLSWTPLPIFDACGAALGCALRLAGFRHDIVRDNLLRAFPELDPARQLVVFLNLLERAARQGARRAA